MSKYNTSNHYLKFLSELNGGLLDQKNFDVNEELDKLFKLEDRCRKILTASKKGIQVYQDFIRHITDVERNILASRIFFREREVTFCRNIPNLIRKRDAKGLSEFAINYKFLQWALSNSKVPQQKKMQEMFDEICRIRQRILEQSLPLVINRSRLFQVRTRKFESDAVEFIQVASEGFLSAIDKYVPSKGGNFNGVAVGWMQAKLMAESAEGFLKLSIKERRILYRANLAMYRHGFEDINKILAFVRESYPEVKREVLERIIASSRHLASIDVMQENFIDSSEEVDQTDSEEGIIEKQDHKDLYDAISKLSVLERKVVILKGGL